jgi:PTS system N-acetylglucosamine-specific IIC component
MPRPRKPRSPFRYFNSSPEVISLVVTRVRDPALDSRNSGALADETVEAGNRATGAERGPAFVTALGGSGNLRHVSACTTRLRLMVADQSLIDEKALSALGAVGVLKPSAEAVQVVLGPIADAVAMDMQQVLARDAPVPEGSSTAPGAPVTLPEELEVAVGGHANIIGITRHPGRWRLELRCSLSEKPAMLLFQGARRIRTMACGSRYRPAMSTGRHCAPGGRSFL